MQMNNTERQLNLISLMFFLFCLIPWIILFFNRQIITGAIFYDYTGLLRSNLVQPISKKLCANICSTCNTEIWQEEWEEHEKIEDWDQKKQMRNAWGKRQNQLINEWNKHLDHLDKEWDTHLEKMGNEWNNRRKNFHKKREAHINEREMSKDPLGLLN